MKPETEKRYREIIRALRKNPDPKVVAEETGYNKSTVYRAIDRMGVELDLLKVFAERSPEAEKKAYRYLDEQGIPKSEIARKCGVTVSYVSQVLS